MVERGAVGPGTTADGVPEHADIERAHLIDPRDGSFSIGRFGPRPDLEAVIRRFWMPTWHVPPGDERRQQVLQYPVSLIVISDDYARFYGIAPGLSETVLTGTGWACGVMLQPATGHLLSGVAMGRFAGSAVELREVLTGAERLVHDVREAMSPDPTDPGRQHAAAEAVERSVAHLSPIGAEAELVNDIVAYAEGKPELLRVADLAEAFGMGERSLQRLTSRWLGLSPKWLLQRRRLHEAAERLRTPADLATIAVDLGYTDQAHFTRDWRRVTGMTPREFARRFAQL